MLDSGLIDWVSQQSQPQTPDGSRTNVNDPPSPKQKWVLTIESFDGMLLWLDHDRDLAGEKYEQIRSKLIRRFSQLGWSEPEQLTNETFDRVARTLPKVQTNYIGPPEPYFFSVAYNIHREHLRRPIILSLVSANFSYSNSESPDPEEMSGKELLDSCLQECTEKLDLRNREMIADYYRSERQEKIRSRQRLAESMGIKLTNLRLRAQRVRATLKKCILDCMERKAMDREALM
jgi:DNA-directed RNA polymerase specialized sigma24 family protein